MTKRAAKSADPGQYLPALAVGHADRARRPKAPLSWSAALAAAPWSPDLPAAYERGFRGAYAARLFERGFAEPAKRSGGKTTGRPGGQTDLIRVVVYMGSDERSRYRVAADAAGLSLSDWIRRKAAT